ncbi:Transmembrane protein [Phytophthora cinnamomi]|uniref:Transmembrane protein n=1 Tax=Phytophthora cinnamomi TaxID=4785 RepID=UPI003559BE91|nr:Transmembrane protein [Phytophthora cinnamomi]
MVHDEPASYVAAQASSNGFCYSGAAAKPTGLVMFNGFQLAIGSDSSCLLLLFQSWVLSSAVKYAFAFLGVVLLAMSLEGFGEFREHIQKRLLQQRGVVVTQADYMLLSTPQVNSASDGNLMGLELKSGHVLPASSKVTVIRRLPLSYKLVLAVLYMAHLCLGYWVMLAVMTYETLMFVAVIVGLGLGFAVFKDTEADTLSGSLDPCCSS